MADVPVAFTVGERTFKVLPSELDARVDWDAFAEEAQEDGNWPLPFRGVKRVALRIFGSDVEPVAEVDEPALAARLAQMAETYDRPGRDAAITLTGLEPVLVADRAGRALNRRESGDLVVRALAGFEREPVALPVSIAQPKVTADQLEPVVEQVRTALSGSVQFAWHDAHWLVKPAQLADMLRLPAEGRSELEVGGEAAEKYFAGLARAVNRKPQEASFKVASDQVHVRVRPSGVGRKLDPEATAKALLAGALSTENREAELVVVESQPKLTTERAKDEDHARSRHLLHAVLRHVRPHPQPPDRDQSDSTGRRSWPARRSPSTTSSGRAPRSAASAWRRPSWTTSTRTRSAAASPRWRPRRSTRRGRPA